MANPEHLAKLKEGVEAWNKWREQRPEIRPDLSGADLREAKLLGANFRKTDLKDADLRQADLDTARFREADLRKADLRIAHLREAGLSTANLAEANLRGADLVQADLGWANLRRANLSMTFLSSANLHGADLEGANLRESKLSRADLTGANLSGANLTEADLDDANLSRADLGKADLSGADLRAATLVDTNLRGANLTGCLVYGISAWNLVLEEAVQSNLVITPAEESPIQVDNLEVAQFIYLLLSRQKLRDVLTTIGEKAVLILGRFTERKELLDRIADKLRLLGYIPMIFDFERPTDLDLTETVKILAGLSRFIIADITNPRSVPLELQATVPDYMAPFVTILQRGQPAFGMFDDLPRKYHWALPLMEYNTADTLLATFEQKVIAPALEKVAEVRRQKAENPQRRSAED